MIDSKTNVHGVTDTKQKANSLCVIEGRQILQYSMHLRAAFTNRKPTNGSAVNIAVLDNL
jgi:hypothetical protein